MKINEWKCNLGPFGGWRRGEQISDLSNNAVQVLVGWIYALLLWGFADMLPEPDAKWEPTWDAMRACAWLCVCFWVHSPAVSFCTDHINDKTEAWATGCSLKREWGKKCERKRSQSVEEYETPKENENWSLKIWELKKWKYTKTAQATTWLSTCWTTILPLALSSSFPSLSSPPPVSLSLWGPGLLLSPPHIVTVALRLWHSCCWCCSSAELGWSRLYLTGRRSSLHLMSGDGQRGGGGEEGAYG